MKHYIDPRRLVGASVAILFAGTFTAQLRASEAVISTGPYTGGATLRDGYTSNATYQGTVGYSFTPGVDITVNSLGYYDGPNSNADNAAGYTPDGLLNAHQVAIWDTSASPTPIVGATVPATLPIPPVSPVTTAVGDFQYVPITPTVLHAGVTYIIGGEVTAADNSGTGDVFRDDNANSYYGPGFAVSKSITYYSSGTGFAKPDHVGTGYFGGSFLYSTSTVSVVNPKFTSPGVGAGFNGDANSYTPSNNPNIVGWGSHITNSAHFGGAGLVSDTNSTTHDTQALYIDASGNSVYQDVGTLAPNTKYTVSVYASERVGNDAVGTISLLNGTDETGAVLNYNQFVPAADGSFNLYSTTFTTGSSVSGDLTILLANVGGSDQQQQVAFDDVTLTAVTPEPGALSLLGGGIAVAFLRRQRRV